MTPRLFASPPFRSPLLLSTALAGASLLLSACGRDTPEAETGAQTEPKTETAASDGSLQSVEQRVSYGMGYSMSSNLNRMGIEQVDREAVLAGIEDGMAGKEMRVAEKDMMAAFATVQEQATAIAAKQAEANQAAARAYLEQNRQRPEVKVTASGLQYEVLESGTGPKPKATDTVEVHYHGTLLNGTVFDSSVQRGETIQFPVNGVIPGWTEALQLMSVGDKWKLTIPPELAYGPRAAGKIPPNSALIFDVELISIK